MPIINIYLNFNGNCKEAFDFYKSVFGGEYNYIATFGEMPPQEGIPPLSEEMKSKIMHVSLPISKETSLMGSDTNEGWGPAFVAGNNFSVSLGCDTYSEVDKYFQALSVGGEIIMPVGNTFWGSYFGMFVDKFGISWMVSCENK